MAYPTDTLADIRTQVYDRLGVALNDPLFPADVVNRAVNSANRRLGRQHDWPWLITTGTISLASTVNTFDLSTISTTNPYRHTRSLGYKNDKLEYVSWGALLRTNQQVGRPSRFSIQGNTLAVTPVPDLTYVFDHVYVIDEAPLLTENSTPLLPAAYSELLVLAACRPLAMRKRDQNLLGMVVSEYKDALREARDEVLRSKQLPAVEASDMWTTA